MYMYNIYIFPPICLSVYIYIYIHVSKQVTDYVNMLAEGGCKFLVFAHHKDVLTGICNSLSSQKPPVQHIRIGFFFGPDIWFFFPGLVFALVMRVVGVLCG